MAHRLFGCASNAQNPPWCFGARATPHAGRPRDGALRNRDQKKRFAGTWLGRLPVPIPKHYLMGIDLQQRDFEDDGYRSSMAGTFQEQGWRHYDA